MEYEIYKMNFLTGVHFGDGMLNQSGYTFCADTLFSALYIEALKLGKQNEFLQAVQRGDLLLSDGLPYVGDRYMIPKPMLYIESSRKGDSEEKKKYKKLKYFPVEHLEDFLRGALNLDQDPMHEFGHIQTQTMAAVRGQEETTPFYVGRYHYREGNGLYMIAAYKTAKEKEMLEEFPRFKNSKKLHEKIVNINTLEEKADQLFISSMRNLHTTCDDPVMIIVWREIYIYLEKCVDACEHVADTVESVIMKNS